jgi:amino acid transporter
VELDEEHRTSRSDGGQVFVASSVGWVLGGVVFVIIWVALAFWPARVAGRKGHSFLGYFLLSLLFFPLALIMAYVVQDRLNAIQ